MTNKLIKPLTLAIGTGLVGSLALVQIAQANPTFQMNSLVAGYALAGTEGKCGEGKCGATKGKKCTEMPDKAAQDKCVAEAHADKAKGKEGSCSADKKGKEGSCSADKKGKEGSCSADKKGKEGSCSGH
ncbi:MAG: hypothetical protein J0I77_20115 [Rudaea sp.]|uniref:hypothetical protein n=1 Tax=unclassified Rudaea TaxID=2627037 RepID=UPI0010F53E6E|nr:MULTISPECIES: hypothetical protein [unclassified Rudaea]MBN8888029.1 hypothetical protein [Rudaea sp.]MBR0347165.1 hypothetical protein [Rudaea sp.]